MASAHQVSKARLWATLAAFLCAPLLVVIFVIGGAIISLHAGGTLGGYGAGPQEPTAAWWPYAIALWAMVFVVTDLFIAVAVYRWRLRKLK